MLCVAVHREVSDETPRMRPFPNLQPAAIDFVGSGDERRNKEILELLLELMGQTPDAYDHVPDRPGHDRRYFNDTTKIRTEFGRQPVYGDFRAGLAATIGWYRANE